MERGAGLPVVDRLAYLAEHAEAQLAGTTDLIVAGARAPVSFFGYPGRPSDLVPAGCPVTVLAQADQDAETALERLADQVAAGVSPAAAPAARPALERGPLTATALARAVARVAARARDHRPMRPTRRGSRCPRRWPARRGTPC